MKYLYKNKLTVVKCCDQLQHLNLIFFLELNKDKTEVLVIGNDTQITYIAPYTDSLSVKAIIR